MKNEYQMNLNQYFGLLFSVLMKNLFENIDISLKLQNIHDEDDE